MDCRGRKEGEHAYCVSVRGSRCGCGCGYTQNDSTRAHAHAHIKQDRYTERERQGQLKRGREGENKGRKGESRQTVKEATLSVGTNAHTLPPNPAPNADAASAPSARADLARKTVSGTLTLAGWGTKPRSLVRRCTSKEGCARGCELN